MFDILVPHYYGELYSLYNILHKAEALDNAEFESPTVLDGNLSLAIHLSNKLRKKIMEYLESKKFIVKYLKNDNFNVNISKTESGVYVTFVRI